MLCYVFNILLKMKISAKIIAPYTNKQHTHNDKIINNQYHLLSSLDPSAFENGILREPNGLGQWLAGQCSLRGTRTTDNRIRLLDQLGEWNPLNLRARQDTEHRKFKR